MGKEVALCRFVSIEESAVELRVKTTYIGKDGRVILEKEETQRLYYSSVLPRLRKSATIKTMEGGYKIVVSTLRADPVKD